MEYLRRFIRELTVNIIRKPQENIDVSRLDAYFHIIYKILLWEDPILSWTMLGVLHILFWIVVQFHLRLYGIIFVTILIGFLVDLYFERRGLQAPRSENSNAIRKVLDTSYSLILYLKVLRKDNPSMFCGLMCIVFLTMSIISKNVPGYFFAYIIVIFIFFGPVTASKLPYKNSITNTVLLLNNNEGILAETELIPYIIDKEMNEKDSELESLLTDRTLDSVTSSLINGINSMPSYLEAEGSLDGLEEEDLVPTVKPSSAIHTPEYDSSDSDFDQKNMKLDPTHLSGDSSSDDEKYYTTGLSFSEVQEVSESTATLDTRKHLTEHLTLGLFNNLTTAATSIISNLTSTSGANKQQRKDSDSDFEFVNTEDAEQ